MLQLTIGGDTHENLRRAQALLSHELPSADLAAVLDLALDALVEKLEKRAFAKTDKSRPRRRRSSADPRHTPAHERRAVAGSSGRQPGFGRREAETGVGTSPSALASTPSRRLPPQPRA